MPHKADGMAAAQRKRKVCQLLTCMPQFLRVWVAPKPRRPPTTSSFGPRQPWRLSPSGGLLVPGRWPGGGGHLADDVTNIFGDVIWCVGVGHEQAGELALLISLDELDASRPRDDAQLVEPAMVVLPCDGPDAVTHDRLEQSHASELSQIDAAPMLAFARSAEVRRSP